MQGYYLSAAFNVIRTTALLFTVCVGSGCASGFHISRQTEHIYPETQAVALVFQAPQAPFEVIARFHGKEPAQCPENLPYCSLRQTARRLGADAIWITRVDNYQYPGDWILIDGRMTRIHPYSSEQVEGKLIRYRKRE